MKFLVLIMALGAMQLSASEPIVIEGATGWAQVGHTHYEHCEFKDAARAFSKALHDQPQDASLHHWLGKSYARMAEVASPLHAARDARRARTSLERAVELAPANQRYLRELFDFYLDSPEYFHGGLSKAEELIQRLQPEDPGAQAFLRDLVSGAREEYRGPTWRFRQSTLLSAGQMGRIVP